jgi:hypothetical protein
MQLELVAQEKLSLFAVGICFFCKVHIMNNAVKVELSSNCIEI